jgi:hypothetical protein
MEKIEMAKKLADMAADIDWEKNEWPDETRELGFSLVVQLYALAEKLADQPIEDIYSTPAIGEKGI